MGAINFNRLQFELAPACTGLTGLGLPGRSPSRGASNFCAPFAVDSRPVSKSNYQVCSAGSPVSTAMPNRNHRCVESPERERGRGDSWIGLRVVPVNRDDQSDDR